LRKPCRNNPESKKTVVGILLSLLFILSIIGCQQEQAGTVNTVTQDSEHISTVQLPPDEFSIEMYFTDPGKDEKPSPGWDLINTLTADIDSAQRSIDIAMYNFSLREAGDALIKAAHRGVQVRIAVDSDSLDGMQLQRLKKAGFYILGDRRESLMHNKYLIIDDRIIWTGSMNLTFSGAMEDENVMARIVSPELAANYAGKFNTIFNEDKFGPESRLKTIRTEFAFSGLPLENYFSPEDVIDSRLVSLVDSAEESVHLLAYSFTLDHLADALIRADRRGVTVSGVFDEDSTFKNQGTDFEKLRQAGLDVRLDGDPGLMHIKAIIVDGETVVFGSYNFTASAENRNDENVLLVTDKELAGSFMQAFNRIYQKSKP
jgi:phosphatidylserine/phosphatidylglycerophosphate/cardiolipin synthase-like enzyme